MGGRRVIVAGLVVLLAVLLQLTAIANLPFPIGLPDLPVLGVIALALVWGSAWGAVVGFAAGLCLDMAPPADHAVGQLAFAYAIVGYLAGILADEEERPVLVTILVVVVGSALLVAIDAAFGIVLGDGTVNATVVGRLLIATVGYDVVLAPFVVPLISRLARRIEPAGVR